MRITSRVKQIEQVLDVNGPVYCIKDDDGYLVDSRRFADLEAVERAYPGKSVVVVKEYEGVSLSDWDE